MSEIKFALFTKNLTEKYKINSVLIEILAYHATLYLYTFNFFTSMHTSVIFCEEIIATYLCPWSAMNIKIVSSKNPFSLNSLKN